MEQSRTDGQAVIKESVMPTEQASVQLPTAEGEVGQFSQSTLSVLEGFPSGLYPCNP